MPDNADPLGIPEAVEYIEEFHGSLNNIVRIYFYLRWLHLLIQGSISAVKKNKVMLN